MGELGGRDNGTSKRVLDALEVIELAGRQSEVERVTVVELGVYKGCGNGGSSFEVQKGLDAVEVANVEEAAARKR